MPIPACIGRITGVPIGTRVMLSTPAAMTTSWVPLITACAAKCSACCEMPHWRSMLTAGTLSGSVGGQHHVAADVEALLADLADAADDDVVDRRRVDAGTRRERIEDFRAQVGRMPVAQRAAAPAACGAQRFDDIGFGHCDLLRSLPRTKKGAPKRPLSHSDGGGRLELGAGPQPDRPRSPGHDVQATQ